MGKRISQQLGLGGQYTAGDPASAPDGSTMYLQNYLTRPGRLSSRPPFTYDNLMAVNGLANFDDQTNKMQRLVAINESHQVFTKAAVKGSETWGSANATTISGTRLSSYANYRGKTYMMFDNGTAGLPSGAAVYDGTTVSTSPFSSAIVARCVTVFKERLYFSYPRLTFTAWFNGSTLGAAAYDFTPGNGWALTNASAANVVAGGGTICRLYLTSTTASSFTYSGAVLPSVGPIGVSASSASRPVVWRFSARNGNASSRLPYTLTLRVSTLWPSGTAFSVGDLISDGTNMQRCIVAGTTGGGTPSWSTTLGGTTTDGGVTWQCEGSDIVGKEVGFLSAAVDGSEPTVVNVLGTIPPSTNSITVKPTCLFANTTMPTITLGSVDMSFKDGLADGDPAKANWGQQFTLGDFNFPFFNKEQSRTATIDLEEEVWSELGLPTVILAANTYKLREGSGPATAACTIGSRKLTFKRDAFWQFQSTTLADIPIRQEKLNEAIGCIGPLALDTFENVVYFIGENDIYAYSVKDDDPTPICGQGMREVIMAQGADWVESQATYNRPILKIDQTQLIMWVYTQKGKLFAYDLRSKQWGTHLVGSGIEIDCMEWNANTGNFYVAFASGTYGLAVMDYAVTGQDTIDNTATNLPVQRVIEFKPIELTDPARYDAYCEGMQILYKASGTQAVELAISSNQGATYPNTVDYTTVMTSTDSDFVPMTLDVCETGPSVTLKLTATGDSGEEAWSLSTRAMVKLEIMKGEYPQTNPTAGAANL